MPCMTDRIPGLGNSTGYSPVTTPALIATLCGSSAVAKAPCLMHLSQSKALVWPTGQPATWLAQHAMVRWAVMRHMAEPGLYLCTLWVLLYMHVGSSTWVHPSLPPGDDWAAL
jgi:hypothetical protein